MNQPCCGQRKACIGPAVRAAFACLAFALCAATNSAHAIDTPADETQQRERLAGERNAVQARYESALRQCRTSFAVTGCVNQAKVERRRALDRIAREQLVLDDTQRKRRAEDRLQRIAQKQQAVAGRVAASAPEVQVRPARPGASAASAARPSRRAQPRSSEAAAAEEAAARQRQVQAEQRRERAAAHAKAVRQRNAERVARKPPAASLPAPGVSAPAASSVGR